MGCGCWRVVRIASYIRPGQALGITSGTGTGTTFGRRQTWPKHALPRIGRAFLEARSRAGPTNGDAIAEGILGVLVRFREIPLDGGRAPNELPQPHGLGSEAVVEQEPQVEPGAAIYHFSLSRRVPRDRLLPPQGNPCLGDDGKAAGDSDDDDDASAGRWRAPCCKPAR